MGGFLCLLLNSGRVLINIIFLPPWRIGIISLPISRREIHGYKVPSTYT
jgi:hypothetical protein